MDRQGHLCLRDQSSFGIGDRRRMVVSLLNVGRKCASHDCYETLIRDGFKSIPANFQCNRIKWFVHVSKSTIRFKAGSTVAVAPGGMTVVESNCAMIAGPRIFVPIGNVSRR